MADGYSWNYARGDGGNRLPGPEHLGWWAAVAMILSVLLHVAVFIALGKLEIVLSFNKAEELQTGHVNVRRVEVRPTEDAGRLEPDKVVEPPKDTASLLDEIDLLDALPDNEEIDIKPSVDEASFALQMSRPAAEGIKAEMEELVPEDPGVDVEMPEIGVELQPLPPAAVGQVTVDPRVKAGDDELSKFTDEILKQGANGSVPDGALDGVASLDSLLNLPANLLISKKTMLPSDLLFEFNSSDLRESAKVGLMKLALLMDRNPGLYCWIEGHTDLIGGDEYNRRLSLQRAKAVKSYLVGSLRMDDERIIAIGKGRSQPIVAGGDADQQAPNRRVEIKMRKTLPGEEQGATSGERGARSGEQRGVQPQRAVLVNPVRKAIQVEPEEVDPPRAVPRAVLVKPGRPIEEVEPEAPRAQPVVPESPPRAQAVELPPRARAVEE